MGLFTKVRSGLSSIEYEESYVNYDAIEEACRFFTRDNDYDQVLAKNVGRYAFEYVPAAEESTKDGGTIKIGVGNYLPSLMVRKGEVDKFVAGVYETVSTGIGHTIANVVANLFTSDSQRWVYLSDKDTKAVESLIAIHRDKGGFNDKLSNVDYLACGVNCCLMHIYPKGEWLSYDVVWSSNIRVVFGKKLKEETSRGVIDRVVDYTDIEDASAVVVKLKTLDSSSGKYLWTAYVGSCDDHIDGRMVTYEGGSFWPIPDIGDERIVVEYKRDDAPCNPLTYVARREKGIGGGYEYPFIIIKGDQKYGSVELMPNTLTFLNNSLEIECAWSQILRQGVKAARGKDVLNLSAAGTDLPTSLDVVVCPDGVEYDYKAGNAGGVQAGISSVQAVSGALCTSRGVPNYIVISEQTTPESGIALVMRTAPLISARSRRINMNKEQISRIADIEMGLLFEMFPENIDMFLGVSCMWDPGKWEIPKDRITVLEELEKENALGVVSKLEMIKRLNNLKTNDDAKKFAELMGLVIDNDISDDKPGEQDD